MAKKLTDVSLVCPVCAKEYMTKTYEIKHGKGKSCSTECSYVLRGQTRKLNNIDKPKFDQKAYNKSYYLDNKERIKKNVKTYREMTGYVYKLNDEQKQKSNARARAWYRANKQLVKDRAKKWKRQNPEKIKVNTRNYASRKRAAGKFSHKDYMKLYNQLLGKCGYCSVNNANTIDHIVPLSRGGSNYIGNIMPSCGSCNYSKQHKTLMEWRNGVVSCTRDVQHRWGTT